MMAWENFTVEEEEVNQNHNLHGASPSTINLKPKTPDLWNLNDYKNLHQFAKIISKETR